MISLVREGKNPDPETGRRAIAQVVKAMREDLWKKTKLDDGKFTYIDVLPHNTEQDDGINSVTSLRDSTP